jgi:hypothetical protein
LIAKLEMAKFLQDTLEETALLNDKKDADGNGINKKFAEFMKQVSKFFLSLSVALIL